jgi:methyl-accepting chemotaxis protein
MSRNTIQSKVMENGFKAWADQDRAELKKYCQELFDLGSEQQEVFLTAARRFKRTPAAIAAQWKIIEGADMVLEASRKSTPKFKESLACIQDEFKGMQQLISALQEELSEYKEQNGHLKNTVRELRENTADKSKIEALNKAVASLSAKAQRLEKEAAEWEQFARNEEKKSLNLIEENNRLIQDLSKMSEAFAVSSKYVDPRYLNQEPKRLERVK